MSAARGGLVKAALGLAAVALPLAVGALEPRYDHRDMHGPLIEALLARDSVGVGGETADAWRRALRLGYGVEVSGEGDELVLDVEAAAESHADPERERVLLGAGIRYRAYFGTEQAKSFFEFGVRAPLRSRLAIGPALGVGFAYDFSRAAGLFAAAGVWTAFGQARITSVTLSAGAQLRFDLL